MFHYRLSTLFLLFGLIAHSALGTTVQIGDDIDGEAAPDKFGRSIALSDDGTTLAVGANQNEGNGYISGHVRVYRNDSGAWTQIGSDIDGETAFDNSGWSVALSADGTTLAVGAPLNDGVNGSNSGHVRVYQNVSGTWTQIGSDIDGEAADDNSGWSVALSADGATLAVGAYKNGGVNGAASGHVRVYRNDSGTWTQVGGDIDGETADDNSGYSVALSVDGTTLAVGAPLNDGVNGAASGHVRVYRNISGTWTQIGSDIDGETADDNSGWSVALSADGATLATGAYNNTGVNGAASGHVRVYRNDSGVWTQTGSDIDGEAADDKSGRSVALSADGATLAVGAPSNNGINGNDSGHVRIYGNDLGTWTQIGSDIDGEAALDDSGQSVALSDDGATLAVGAPSNDGVNGGDSGHVRVYYTFQSYSQIVTSRTLGQQDVTGSPSTYSLFTQSNVSTAEDASRTLGQQDVTSSPSTYSLFTQGDVSTSRTLGQEDVTGSPTSYNLYTESQVDAATATARTIVNASARVNIGGNETIIPGFVVLGESKKLLIRAVGPKLADLNVPSPLPDPTMTIYKTRYDGNPHDVVAVIDDWKDGDADVAAINAAMATAGAFPLEPTDDFKGSALPTDDTKSAATLVTLSTGVYTVVVTSADGEQGDVLVEVYEIIE